MSNIEQGMPNFEGNARGFSLDIRNSLFDILRFRSSLLRWGYQGAKPLAWQSNSDARRKGLGIWQLRRLMCGTPRLQEFTYAREGNLGFSRP